MSVSPHMHRPRSGAHDGAGALSRSRAASRQGVTCRREDRARNWIAEHPA